VTLGNQELPKTGEHDSSANHKPSSLFVKHSQSIDQEERKEYSMAEQVVMEENNEQVLGAIGENTTAFSHVPEHGFSLFLANRTKTIHFVRHAEGTHNAANRIAGDDTPVTYDTEGAWVYQDAKLTATGIQQCLTARTTLLTGIHPELVVVSPFSRTLQTAHIMFGGAHAPFLVHHLCGERRGKFTCDKRRDKAEIVHELKPVFDYTGDRIDFDSFGYPTDSDEEWTETREPDDSVTARAIAMMQWLGTRPEKDIAVVTHSSWLKHLFRAFGDHIDEKDKTKLHRLSGNAEVRSITLALHKGFYPEGQWEPTDSGEVFVPAHHSFRRGRYAPAGETVAKIHQRLVAASSALDHAPGKPELKEHESMPY
jgi:broad specificity phosphatase PhoE